MGDVDPDDVMRRVEHHFGRIPQARCRRAWSRASPISWASGECGVERPGTTAYLKLAWHAPAVTDPDFHPMLVLDAALTGAKGVNLWASFRNPPQRSTRLYRALVETGLAASVFGALLPTEHPFLYAVSCTVSEGTAASAVESAAQSAIADVRKQGITAEELQRARHQLRARLVFESDSVTNIAHQIEVLPHRRVGRRLSGNGRSHRCGDAGRRRTGR